MARNDLIQVRRDTAANWTDNNPILATGEIGFETDTGKLKVGTASTAWNSLLYVTDASDVSGVFSSGIFSGSSSTDLVRITQTGTGNALVVEDSNPDSTPLVVDASGNVVIGQVSTSTTSTGVVPKLQVVGLNNDTSSSMQYNFANDSTTTVSTWAKSRGGSFGTQGAVVNADSIGNLNFEASDGTQLRRAVSINALVDATPTAGVVQGRLQFQTANSSGTLTERMRINSAGEVGIASPPTSNIRLTITGGSTNSANPVIMLNGVSGSGALYFHNDMSAGSYNPIVTAGAKGIIATGANNTTTRGALVIAPWSDVNYGIRFTGGSTTDILVRGTTTFTPSVAANKALIVQGVASQAGDFFDIQNSAGTSQFKVDSAGNVGIGTTTPTSKLEVDGSATIDSQANVAAQFGTSGGTNNLLVGSITGNTPFVGSQGASALTFRTNNAERIRIDSDGNVGIGTTSLTGISFRVNKNITGAINSYASIFQGTVQADVTSQAYGVYASLGTTGTPTTAPTLTIFAAVQGTLAGTVTSGTQRGYFAASNLIGATNNYAFQGAIPSGPNTNYNLYMNGTAPNYLAGRLGIGATLTSGAMAQITNTTAGDKAFVVRGAFAQSGNYFEIQNYLGNTLTALSSNGILFNGANTSTSYGVSFGASGLGFGSSSIFQANISSTFSAVAGGTLWNDSTGSAVLTIGKSRGTTTGDFTIVQDGDGLGAISIGGADSARILQAARIGAVVDGPPALDVMFGAITFATNAGGVNVTERMRINSAGNVGIGTASPTEKLDVAGNIALTGSIVFEGATANEFETTLAVTDPNADRTITLPNASGTVALLGTIALGTDTTGNYMSGISGTSPVSVAHTAGEGSSATVSLASNYGDTLNPYAAKTAAFVLAGPTTGAAAVPTFRAIVATDIPTLNQNTTGSAATAASSSATTFTSSFFQGTYSTLQNDHSLQALRSGNGGTAAGVALWVTGIACQFRLGTGEEKVFLQNSANTSPAGFRAIIDNASSRHLKQDIKTFPMLVNAAGSAVNEEEIESGLNIVRQLRPVTYKWKEKLHLSQLPSNPRRALALSRLNEIRSSKGLEPYESDELQHDCSRDDCNGTAESPCSRVKNWENGNIGFIAQEVGAIIPQAANLDKDGEYSGLDNVALTAIAVASIKELDLIVESLKERIKQLEESNINN